MKIAAFNVNSIGARLPRILEWFDSAKPDIAVLQELKCVSDKFPELEFGDRGYNCAVNGQKSYNGVALLSKFPMEDVVTKLPGDESDEQARYVEAFIAPPGAGPVRVCGLYAPNGNPAPGPKYDYKLSWLKRLKTHAQSLLALEEALVVCGDFNVIPQAEDAKTPAAWERDALYLPQTRAAWREIVNLGFTDALRQARGAEKFYTFWDYQAGAWEKNNGIRIDHLLLSPQAADRLVAAGVDREERAKERPSDHAPVWVEVKG